MFKDILISILTTLLVPALFLLAVYGMSFLFDGFIDPDSKEDRMIALVIAGVFYVVVLPFVYFLRRNGKPEP